MQSSKPRTIGLAAMILTWGIAVCLGYFYMLDYSGTPGTVGIPEERWPKGSSLVCEPDKINVIMFVHPKCPCTFSSVEELSRILAHSDRQNTSVQFVFCVPTGLDPSWAQSDLWAKAQEIPQARLSFDADGVECRRFGALTSGYVVAYDASGRLRFSGGITPARNHQGTSQGGVALTRLISGEEDSSAVSVPVYGCPVFASSEECPVHDQSNK